MRCIAYSDIGHMTVSAGTVCFETRGVGTPFVLVAVVAYILDWFDLMLMRLVAISALQALLTQFEAFALEKSFRVAGNFN